MLPRPHCVLAYVLLDGRHQPLRQHSIPRQNIPQVLEQLQLRGGWGKGWAWVGGLVERVVKGAMKGCGGGGAESAG